MVRSGPLLILIESTDEVYTDMVSIDLMQKPLYH